MYNWWNQLLVFFIIISLCYSQNDVPLTEPKLLSITPVNSTALTVSWQFASSIYDQSDFIQISIVFYEFFYNYGPENISINYLFSSTNKTITNLTENFQIVNAFYYVCFSSNSTIINSTIFLAVTTCQLIRTCSRINASICPQNNFVIISSTNITPNSFTILVQWLNNLPYTQNSTAVQLVNNGVIGTSLSSIENDTYIILPYQFSNLQSQTSYTVNIIVTYILFDASLTDIMNYTVTTSRSSNLFYTGDSLMFIAWSVLLSF